MQILCLIVTAYFAVCIARIIFSFIPVEGGGFLPAAQSLAFNLTEPLFAAVRNALPRPADLPIDLGGIVVILVVSLTRSIVC